MLFNFSIKSKILINFVELFYSKTPQRSLHSFFADFILFINYFHLSFFVCVLLLLAIKSVCLSVSTPLIQLKLKLNYYANIVVTLTVKYKIDFKRCWLYLRIFIKPEKTPREHKEASVLAKAMPSVPRKIMN